MAGKRVREAIVACVSYEFVCLPMASGSGAGAAVGIENLLRLQRRAFTPIAGESNASGSVRKRLAGSEVNRSILGGMAQVTIAA